MADINLARRGKDRIAIFVVDHVLLAWTVLLMSAMAVGWFVGEGARRQLEQERLSTLRLDAQRRGIQLMSQTLNGNRMGAIGLLGLINDHAKQEALNQRPPNSPDAVVLMENLAHAYDADGAYIIGQDGIIKSSWGAGKPLTGVDVRFRPYTRMALTGRQNVYAAIGTTTGRRNLYYASPLYAGNTKESAVIGAVVMRSGVVELDKEIAGAGDIALLVSPQGLIFAASREEWIGHATGRLSPEQIAEIRQLRQFGTLFDHNDPTLLAFSTEPGIRNVNGIRHAVTRSHVAWNDPYGDWMLVTMEDLSHTVPAAESLRWGVSAGAAFLVFGWLLIHLLRGRHAQRIAGEQLAAYSHAQQVAAEHKAQLADAAMHLQRSKDTTELIQVYFYEAHRILGALQGVVYVVDAAAGTTLRLAGHYACAEAPPESLSPGEGLLGQCAIERRVQVIEMASHSFAIIRSGLGSTVPRTLMMAPIVLNDNLLGVVELALVTLPDAHDREQFEALTGILALDLQIFSRSNQTGGSASPQQTLPH